MKGKRMEDARSQKKPLQDEYSQESLGREPESAGRLSGSVGGSWWGSWRGGRGGDGDGEHFWVTLADFFSEKLLFDCVI